MKTKLFTLLLAVVASVGTILAWDYERVQIGDLYYNLDATNKTAEVTSQISSYPYWSTTITTANIPASVTYNSVTYNVTSVGSSAFNYCTGLTSITIPNSVTSIGDYAFYYCSGLTSVTIPNSVTSIGGGAFLYCSGLTSPVYNAHVFAFMPTSYFGAYTIPDGIESIAGYAFSGCSGLTSVTIPNSVTSIGDYAFLDCSVSTINYIGSMDEWCHKAWSPSSISGNYQLQLNGVLQQSTVIPNSVTTIGGNAFSGCTSLTSVTIPNSVTSIGDYAFLNCSGLTSISVAMGNTVYDSRNNCNAIIETATNTLMSGCQKTIIPNSVTNIGDAAFFGCRGLTSVTIPNSVTSIGEYAFCNCTGLTSITIPNSVISIGGSAFSGCSGLTSITIPNSVTSIGNSAFYKCSGLTSITCEAMNPPTCGVYAFEEVPKSILYVPFGSEDAYRNAKGWKDFTNIQPIKAANVDITTTEVVPDETSVNIAWPKVSGAASYELVIKDKSGKVVCTLVFDAEGRLLSITFNAPARDNMPQQTHVAGLAFTVTGLNSGTTYNYSIVAKDSNGNPLNIKSGSFTTTGESTDLQNVTDQLYETKFFRNGQLFIQRDGKTYSVTGQEVK